MKDKINTNIKQPEPSKLPLFQNCKERIIPIISQKRRDKTKHKALFQSSHQKDLLHGECFNLKNQECFINKGTYEDEQERNAYLLQAMRNETYLKNKRNMRKEITNEGFSIVNTNNHGWLFDDVNHDQQVNGLNKFTNIVIKRLQKKTKKVSFSQFLQDKKHQDYLQKFKHEFSKKCLSKNDIRDRKACSSEQINFKGVLSKNSLEKSPQQLKKHSRSVILTEKGKKSSIHRHYSKLHQRYHSITGLQQNASQNLSLEISGIKGPH